MESDLLKRTSGALRALPRRTQWVIVGIAALAVTAVVVVGTSLSALFTAGEKTTAASQGPPGTFRPTKEQWAGIVVKPIEQMRFRTEDVTDGNIAIDDELTTPVFSPYSGHVTKLIAKLGDAVRRGDPLMAVEASEFVQGQNDLIAAVAALSTARSQLALAQNNEQRLHDLYLAKGGALKDWQQSQADLITAQGGLRTAEIALAAVRNRLRILGKSDREINALENMPSGQRMDAEALVLAPINGTVIQRQVGLGQYIQSGASNPVYSIADLSTLWLIANVREADAPLVRVGQPVEVRVLAYPGRVFKAKISYVAPSVDPSIHRLPVRADVENPDNALKPQMFASFSIITGEEVEAPGLPESAIIYEGSTARVWVVQAEGLIGARQIRTGRISNGMVEVVDGVKPGEKVVTSGALFIDRAASGD